MQHHCGKCHTCGTTLQLVHRKDYCPTCRTFRLYRSHGWAVGLPEVVDSPCLNKPDVVKTKEQDTASKLPDYIEAQRKLLADCLAVLRAVKRSEQTLHEELPISVVAEILAHYNGYAGAPNIDAVINRLEGLLND